MIGERVGPMPDFLCVAYKIRQGGDRSRASEGTPPPPSPPNFPFCLRETRITHHAKGGRWNAGRILNHILGNIHIARGTHGR